MKIESAEKMDPIAVGDEMKKNSQREINQLEEYFHLQKFIEYLKRNNPHIELKEAPITSIGQGDVGKGQSIPDAIMSDENWIETTTFSRSEAERLYISEARRHHEKFAGKKIIEPDIARHNFVPLEYGFGSAVLKKMEKNYVDFAQKKQIDLLGILLVVFVSAEPLFDERACEVLLNAVRDEQLLLSYGVGNGQFKEIILGAYMTSGPYAGWQHYMIADSACTGKIRERQASIFRIQADWMLNHRRRVIERIESKRAKLKSIELGVLEIKEVFMNGSLRSRKKILLEANKLHPKLLPMFKRIQGLYRVLYDLDTVKKMCEKALQDESTFLTYQGIVITYRKCFDRDPTRGASLTDKHLNGLTNEEKIFHNDLIKLGNENVAHHVSEDYDMVHVYLILDQINCVVNIDIEQDLREPLDRIGCKKLCHLVETIRFNLEESIFDLKDNLIKEINDNPTFLQDLQICRHNPLPSHPTA